MSVEYDVWSASSSRASASPVTSQTSTPRKVTTLATGPFCLAQLADAVDGLHAVALQRPGETLGHAVEPGQVDARAAGDERAAYPRTHRLQD